MKILIFAGPTISSQEIGKYLDALVLPPANQGDILTALDRYRPQAIALIDSAFPRSSWVSEVHYALRSGVAVYGAGAQGALRAVELQDYGMKGYGKVFDDFAAGRRTNDDAVLCRYSEKDGMFVRTTETLVNVQASLSAARDAGILDDPTFGRLSQRAKDLYWQERTWEKIFLPELFTSTEACQEGLTWLMAHSVDIQKQDAIELIQALASDRERLQHNIYTPADRSGMLDQLYQRERKANRKSGSVPLYSVAHHAAINHPKPLEVNFNGMNRAIVAFFAERMELEPTEEEIAYEWTIFKHERSLTENSVEGWCRDNDMSSEAMAELIRKNALCRKTHQWMIMKRGMGRATGPFLDELRMRGDYPEYADTAAEIETGKEKQLEKYQSGFSRSSFEEILARREKNKKRPLPWPVPYNQASRVLGISKEELFCELTRETFHQEQTIANIIDELYDEN